MNSPLTQGTGWLPGDVALITGGGSGIGRALALRFLAEGASVAIVGRDLDKLADTVAAAGEAADRILPIAADVTSTDDMHRAVAETITRFGRLDILVPNAGIWDYNRSITRLTGQQLSDSFDEVFAINVKGYLLTVEAAWRELVESRGCVVMTLSNASFYPAGGGPVYTASKHADRGLLLQLAYELAPKVRVNGVAVGGMRTNLRGPSATGLADRSIADSFDRNDTSGNNPLLPLHDVSVEPEDYTGPYVLLASRRNSSTITGSIVNADGGIAARGFQTAAGGDDL
ncbi:SDR family NAD(P)-dependent oxidoreductase [Klugiella xanthotipulae]|uniref:2,3-dihydroxy-2,3-dihydrophenylpropionate dehydrogenase n=1 Tax=Klugiella xanthotipulae TaxID=244735 RepID=A0A543I4B2_9MICO|nr:SDR family NAD(P)-dependent oxidoreductase [Klugiella xanthotipulae]TQM65381.1 2,3-dihydroxy-2,3-dihydrophenylpropionate dehydrogenase [Klugiella xanthotipulae]